MGFFQRVMETPRFLLRNYPDVTLFGSAAFITAVCFYPKRRREEKERRIYSGTYTIFRQDDPAVPRIRPHEHYPIWQTHRDNSTNWGAKDELQGYPYKP